MNNPITLDALQVLDAIDRKGSFAAAANSLYRVPSAITYTVQKLEQDLDVVLFRKEGRRSVLTPAGQLLLEQGREVLLAVEQLAEKTRQADKGWESRLNIAVDSVLGVKVLYPLLADFYLFKPDIVINLSEEVLGGAWDAVIHGRADMAVGAAELPTLPRGLRQVEVAKVEWVFAVSPAHPLSTLDRVLGEDDIRQFRSVVVRDSSRELAPLSLRVFSAQQQLKVGSVNDKIEAIERGLGVGYLPRHRILKQLAEGLLVLLPVNEGLGATPLYTIFKTGQRGRALDWFIDKMGQGLDLLP
ncbi:MAG: LysR substrate-binding domain-containing protein [Pseudomonadales bacterium]